MTAETTAYPKDIYLLRHLQLPPPELLWHKKEARDYKNDQADLKKNRYKFQKFKYIICEIKNSVEQLNRIDKAGEGISKLEDRFERITCNLAQKE